MYIYDIFIVVDNRISDIGFNCLIQHKSDLLNLEYIGLDNNRINGSTIAKIEAAFPSIMLLNFFDEDETNDDYDDDDDEEYEENNNNNDNNNNNINNYTSYHSIPFLIYELFYLNMLNE